MRKSRKVGMDAMSFFRARFFFLLLVATATVVEQLAVVDERLFNY